MGEKSAMERAKLWDEIYLETQNLIAAENALKELKVPTDPKELEQYETTRKQIKNSIMNCKNRITRARKKLNQ
jgi:hypothetical protein